MKVFVVCCIAFWTAVLADSDGRYVHDDSGKYVPNGDEGKYIHDNSGDYNGDGSGSYKGDVAGRYKGDGSGNGGRFSGNRGGNFGGKNPGRLQGQGQFGKDSRTRLNLGSNFGNNNLLGANSFVNEQSVPIRNPSTGNAFGNQGSFPGAFGNTPAAASPVSSTASRNTFANRGSYNSGGTNTKDGRWKIIKQNGDVDLDGYHWDFESENGIVAEESGKLANKGTDAEAMKAKGFFKYTGPDNVVYTVTYTADENGFVPQGNHLPTPPPTPDAILQSLEYLRQKGKL